MHLLEAALALWLAAWIALGVANGVNGKQLTTLSEPLKDGHPMETVVGSLHSLGSVPPVAESPNWTAPDRR